MFLTYGKKGCCCCVVVVAAVAIVVVITVVVAVVSALAGLIQLNFHSYSSDIRVWHFNQC